MAENETWEQTIEKLLAAEELRDLARKYADKISELVEIIRTLKPPSEEYSGVILTMLSSAAGGYPPLPATYIGFMIGIAYEKQQNKE